MPFPFYGEKFTFRQPDETILEVRGWGDQHHAVFETLDGFTVIENPLTSFYEYAHIERGELKPTGLIPSVRNMNILSLPKNLRNDRKVIKSKVFSSSGFSPGKNRWEIRREIAKQDLFQKLVSSPLPAPPQRQTVGVYIGLCILIQFPDLPGNISVEEITAFCNQQGYSGYGNNGSVYDYFHDNSGGRLQYTNIVTPYYMAKHPRHYYTNESIPQPTRAIELIEEALNYHKSNGFDFSQLTSDNENYVFALNIFYAGSVVNNWAKGLWPHSWHLNNSFELAPSKLAFDYQITDMGNELTLGTFCHENGHMICDFPDLYDYGYESRGVGAYCLMCAGGNANKKNPVQIGAYLKLKAGWADRLTTIQPLMQVQIHAGQNDFFIIHHNTIEYYLLEHRMKINRDAAIPDEGLLIWHIDELGNNSNEQQTLNSHYECSLIQADGSFDLERGINDGDQNDCFYAPRFTAISGISSPGLKWWNNLPESLEIFNISTLQNPMQFSTK